MYVAMNHGYEMRGKDDRGESLKHISREEGNTPGQNNQAHTNVLVFQNATLNEEKKVKNNRDGWAGKRKSDRIPRMVLLTAVMTETSNRKIPQ